MPRREGDEGDRRDQRTASQAGLRGAFVGAGLARRLAPLRCAPKDKVCSKGAAFARVAGRFSVTPSIRLMTKIAAPCALGARPQPCSLWDPRPAPGGTA